MGINKYLEQTYLRPDTTQTQIKEAIDQCISLGIFGICIPPTYVSFARECIDEKKLALISVVGFPMGYDQVSTKSEQAKRMISDGADELDMVMNIAAFKSGNLSQVADGIERVSTLCSMHDKKLKVIIESTLLDNNELLTALDICIEKRVDFVKTSTGLHGGATAEAIRLMRSHLPEDIGIKASGGIRNLSSAEKLISEGANRIGTSSGFAILAEA